MPIILVITVFQLAILRQPFPELLEVLMGTALVVIGLMLFVQGLEMGLFPIGETRAVAFARKGSLVWLLLFGFGLGFPTTVAEPALIAITQEPWKMPLRQYIQHLYFKRFGKERSDEIPSIEEKIRSEEEKKARRREAKLQGILAKANKQELDDA